MFLSNVSMISLIALALGHVGAPGVVVYLGTNGSDSNTGESPATALLTPLAARDRVRALRGNTIAIVAEVRVLPGTYELSTTLNLTEPDSNTAWIGLPADPTVTVSTMPTFSGGSEIQWAEPLAPRKDTDPPMEPETLTAVLTLEQDQAARTAGSVFPQLIVDQTRAPIARVPAQPGTYLSWHTAPGNKTGSTLAFGYDPTEVNPTGWASVGEIGEVTALVYDAPWSAQPRTISSINPTTPTVALNPPEMHGPLNVGSFVGTKRWVGLNLQTGPLVPGTYRYRSANRTLTYFGNRPASAVVPRLGTVVRMTNSAGAITFTGLRFAHTASGINPSPASYGPSLQAAIEVGPSAANVAFTACAFQHTGANGLEVFHNVSGVTVSGSVFADLGGRGFTTTLETTGVIQDAENVLITDSVFTGCGKTFLEQPYCIFVSGKRNITVRHNDVSDVPYSGIRVWGHFITDSVATSDFDTGVTAVFTIENNHVHNVGLGELSDFGGIFVTTRPGGAHGRDCAEAYGPDACNVLALVSGNVVHGVRHHDHGGAGIYTDESSGRANITHNLVFNNSGWGVHLHCGGWHTLVNNVFAGNAAIPPAPFPQYMLRDYSAEPFCNFGAHPLTVQGAVVLRNVFDQSVAPTAGIGRHVSVLNNFTVPNQGYGNASNVRTNVTFDFNVYSCSDADCLSDFPGDLQSGRSLKEWQSWANQDTHSLYGNPGFADDPKALSVRRDFRVDPSRSPAVLASGFVPLDLTSVGPRLSNLVIATCSNDGGDSDPWWDGCTFE
eukprot:m.10422 g.10422  ORF g.10422 m.10422 type:complete len:779 (+) comp4318_c0_seq1:371-2707(+)